MTNKRKQLAAVGCLGIMVLTMWILIAMWPEAPDTVVVNYRVRQKWAEKLSPEVLESTYRVLDRVMRPEEVVWLMACFRHKRGEEDAISCTAVHPAVFAIAIEDMERQQIQGR